MSYPAAGAGAYHNGHMASTSSPRMPVRRGGISAHAHAQVHDPTESRQQQDDDDQHDQRQQLHQHQRQLSSDRQISSSNVRATAMVGTTTGRDKNLDSFTANTALPGSFHPIHNYNCDNDDSVASTYPPLQIRFTPHSRQGSVAAHSRQGSVTGLHIKTDMTPPTTRIATTDQRPYTTPSQSDSTSTPTIPIHTLTPSHNLRKAISTASLSSSLSPSGGFSSPYLSAMVDITPLPSPIGIGDLTSPIPWKRLREGEDANRDKERPSSSSVTQDAPSSIQVNPPPRYYTPLSPGSPPKKKKGYGSLMTAAIEAQAAIQANSSAHSQNQAQQRAKSHSRTRSVSDFVPEQLHNTRPRNVTVNLSSGPPHDQHHPMHREQYLAAQRGLINSPIVLPTNHSLHDATKALPSPPPSNKSITGSELDEDERSRPASAHQSQILSPPQEDDSDAEYFLVKDTVNPLKKRKWRALRPLGHGTFSKVLLATSERLPRGTSYDDANLNHKKLVAIKIVEHGPAGGADEERIEVSLKREVDILKSVHHPCIIQLKAMEYTDDRALLVLTYCPGGDLFELASERREVLTKDLVQRIFGEVVSAVRWLHDEGVVHRDLKLENILVYPNADFLSTLSSPQTHPYALTQLTDLGLSRRIPAPPASPLLTTRCGSEDYAAPEILLGQSYDGRATDAWALGVLLYALMEGRLPFDCPPGQIERSRVSHRVARCDWIWTRFGDEDGEWDVNVSDSQEWRAAGEVVEGLLKKVRMGRMALKEVQGLEFVREAVQVEGGLSREEVV